MEANQLQFC